MIAKRYQRQAAGKLHFGDLGFPQLVGIALGVATLIIVMSVMMAVFATSSSRAWLASTAISVSRRSGRPIEAYDAAVSRLRSLPGIVRAAPIIDDR